QLRQAQKMEALGTLSGGIAHDFNNILAAILGFTDLALLTGAKNGETRQHLEKVIQSGIRARDLVQQILTFSRRTEKERIATKVTPIVKEALKLLRATLPATIQISQHMESENDMIIADPVQIHQVLMNLCTNAKHAMQSAGGVLDVSLTDVTLESEESAGQYQLSPGRFLMLQVSDTGDGIPLEIRDRIFDPYFTTKAKGEGTGLGLSVVHGIVKDHGGGIHLISEPGKGTSFQVFFPALEGHEKAERKTVKPVLRGSETILLVDDEQFIVESYGEMLKSLGYKVIAETSSKKALEAFRAQPEKFDLVLTDYTMPEMTGVKLAEEILKIRPDIPVLLCSGFTKDITQEEAKSRGIRAMLSKPFVKEELSEVLRRHLD
ncbi:MAG: response regulator, partial [Desulfobulbaceae bacterium]|nr:response regulator [Desulfobulbaceae bacterium]